MKETLAQIHGMHKGKPFTAGIVLWDDVVVEAAPIVGYMKKRKWSRRTVRDHVSENNWRIEVVHELERAKT